jgi:hypothetical protein
MKSLLLAGACLAVMSAGSAFAGTLDYAYYGWVGDNVQINSPNSIYGGAGQIQLYDAHGKFLADAWCLDVSDYLQEPQLMGLVGAKPGLQEPGGPSGGLSAGQLTEIEKLVVEGDNVMAHGGTADQSAAFQIAIWKTEYGDGFSYDPINADVTADVAGLLAPGAAPAAGGPAGKGPTFDFLVPINPSVSQTLITESIVGAPEPSTWAMLITGFGLMGAVGWRKARGGVGAATAAL